MLALCTTAIVFHWNVTIMDGGTFGMEPVQCMGFYAGNIPLFWQIRLTVYVTIVNSGT